MYLLLNYMKVLQYDFIVKFARLDIDCTKFESTAKKTQT